jgi:uncharacterized protein
MSNPPEISVTAFTGHRLLATGALAKVALAVRGAERAGTEGPVLVFDDASGRVIDLDLRGSEAELRARIEARGAAKTASQQAKTKPRGRGRPRLGVVGREVTLLPRHWDWLERQPDSASQVLRRLIDAARRAEGDTDGAVPQKARAERAYRVMASLAGDLPGYEEALRALFAGDAAAFVARIGNWPEDVAAYALRLAGMDREG